MSMKNVFFNVEIFEKNKIEGVDNFKSPITKEKKNAMHFLGPVNYRFYNTLPPCYISLGMSINNSSVTTWVYQVGNFYSSSSFKLLNCVFNILIVFSRFTYLLS